MVPELRPVLSEHLEEAADVLLSYPALWDYLKWAETAIAEDPDALRRFFAAVDALLGDEASTDEMLVIELCVDQADPHPLRQHYGPKLAAEQEAVRQDLARRREGSAG